MRIINLYAEHLLNLRAVSVTPTGRVTRITGKNGAGKSNVLNAMYYALAGKKVQAEEPILQGENKAVVRLALGEDEVELTVVLRITENDSYLDVESPDGARFRSPRAMLEALVGNLTFDPQAFSRMKPDERLNTLRGLVKLDVDVDRLDQLNARDFTMRTDWNRKIKSLVERVAQLSEGVDESDVTPIDIAALTDKMASASEHNAAIDSLRIQRERTTGLIDAKRREVKQLRDQAERLLREAQALERDANDMQADLDNAAPLAEHIDVTELRDQINNAMRENAQRDSQARQRLALRMANEELDAARVTAKGLTEAMDARDQQKANAIAEAKMPIDGLGFGNGDVTFNGLPFSQASTGQRLRISASIGMALNPKLRVLFVRNGSLLDEDGVAILEQMAEEHDFQLWIEATQSSPTVGVHIVDGAVAYVDGAPVEQQPEPAAV